LGSRNVIIRSIKPQRGEAGAGAQANRRPGLQIQDYGLLHRDLDLLSEVLPDLAWAVPVSSDRADVSYQHRTVSNMRVLGTTPEYTAAKNYGLARGRFLNAVDDERRANVVVLSDGAARQLFSYINPLGKPVYISSAAFLVVGVLARRGGADDGSASSDDLSEVYIPLATARGRFGTLKRIQLSGGFSFERTELSELTLTASRENDVRSTAEMARQLLKRNHPAEADYEVQVPLELLRQANQERRIWNLVLGSVAGISLLVGGIGIMNIMLASVTERTREIGIRRALGAKRGDITQQFLVETVVLSATGGLLGVVAGVALPMAISQLTEIETSVQWWAVLLSLGISVAVGVIFGLYPARRAAAMEPVEALRHE
jgi:putative ABC transport system permease protein